MKKNTSNKTLKQIHSTSLYPQNYTNDETKLECMLKLLNVAFHAVKHPIL